MQRIYDFEEKIKERAAKGELVYGDNIFHTDDLHKFALYNILIGKNINS